MADITIDLDRLTVTTKAMPRVDEAKLAAVLQQTGQLIQKQWAAAVQGQTLSGMTRPVNDATYAVKVASATIALDPESVSVAIDYWRALLIERGHARYDLKPGLLAGRSGRQGRNGRYAPIGLSARAGGAMVVLARPPAGPGIARVTRQKGLPGFLTMQTVATHQSNTGGALTFRTVSDRSPASSWVVPAVQPNPVMQAVADAVRPEAERLVRESLLAK